MQSALVFWSPFSFVLSGMTLDLSASVHSSKAILLIPLFLALFLLVRGAAVILLYRNDSPKEKRLPFALYCGTALPLVLAITNIGVRTVRMSVEIATAMVGAAALSVLLFPSTAQVVLTRNSTTEKEVELAAGIF